MVKTFILLHFLILVNGAPMKHGVKLGRDSFQSSYFKFSGVKWSKFNLTWAAGPRMANRTIRAVTKAFYSWDKVANSVFCFTRINSFDDADVKLTFASADFVDSRKEGVLATTRSGGLVYFNKNIPWGDGSDPVNTYDVETVAVHEIGHVLGLAHSDVQEAVMWPQFEDVKRDLHEDDIFGINSLYMDADLSDLGCF